MAKKITEMTAGDVADLAATTTEFEIAINVTTVPATRRLTFGQLATWLGVTAFAASTFLSQVYRGPASVIKYGTDASGADAAAVAQTFYAPLSTGNATPGSLIFKVGQQVAGSSSTLQTPGTALTLSHTTAGGHLATFANTVSATAYLGANGSAAAPTYGFANSLDSGFYLASAGQIRAAASGAVVFYFTAGAMVFNTGVALSTPAAVTAGTAGSIVQNWGGAAEAATTVTKVVKKVTAIADATPTSVLTVTIPNAANSAAGTVRLRGALGAGGVIGADEASGTVSYDWAVTRTAGVNAVVTLSSAYGSAMANVAGAATITVTAAASAIAGAVGDLNTFTINVTITKGSGASANHTCDVDAEVRNGRASGVSIA